MCYTSTRCDIRDCWSHSNIQRSTKVTIVKLQIKFYRAAGLPFYWCCIHHQAFLVFTWVTRHLLCLCMPTGEVKGNKLHLQLWGKAWPAVRFGVWLHNQYYKSSAAPPYGHVSNEGKFEAESISAVVLISGPAVSKEDTRLECVGLCLSQRDEVLELWL